MYYGSINGGASVTISCNTGLLFTWRRTANGGIWGIAADDVSVLKEPTGALTVTADGTNVTLSNGSTVTCRYLLLKHS